MLKTGLALASVKPVLNEEKKARKEYEQFRPAIERLVAIGEAAQRFTQNTRDMTSAIMPTQEEHMQRAGQQMFIGATSSFVAVAGTVIGAPFVNAWSLVKEGETTITSSDIKDMFSAAGKYLSTDQSAAYADFFNAAGEFDRSVKGFYKAFNLYTLEMAGGNVSRETATILSSAMQEISLACSHVSLAFKNHGAELDEFSGFYTVSKEFAKEAAVTAATSVAIGYVIGKGAHIALHLAKGGTAIAQEAATVAVGAARVERMVGAVTEAGTAMGRAERAVIYGERIAETGHKVKEIRHAGEMMEDEIERRHAGRSEDG